uniref:Uncharacterized protein n=1 Tax=Rousettus aegyptiacus TaxID=9407 RepID=A0A7J8E7Z9_ROUAE|nr:hypothetical protein HJG63_008138 [Rousettus aegyptiacus]
MWAHKWRAVWSQGITRAGKMMLVRLRKSQIFRPPVSAGWVRGELDKRLVDSARTSFWENAAAPALTLKPDNSVSPRMFLASFELLTQRWSSEKRSPSAGKSRHGPLKRYAWDSVTLRLTQPQCPLVFRTGSCGDFSPVTRILSWGAWCGAGTPRFSGSTSKAE